MIQFSFVENIVLLQLPNSLTPKLINLDDVYFITMKPFSFQADQHYQIHMVFTDKEKITDNIIQETADGRFIQSIELYVMLNKTDVEYISYNFGNIFAHPSVVCIQDGKNIQILNLDKADGFDIHQSSTTNVAIDSDFSFFDVQFHPNKDAESIIFHKSEDVLVKISVVFNFLYQYAIETDIPQLIEEIKKLDKNHDLTISSRLSGVRWFLEEHGLDAGFITIHQ